MFLLLRLPGFRLYVVTSPELIHAVQKSHKAFSFNVLIAQILERVCLVDQRAMAVVKQIEPVEADDGKARKKATLVQKIHGATVKHLRPGADMEQMVLRFQDDALARIALLAKGEEGETIMLWDYVRHHFSLATATAFWGPEHPFHEDSRMYTSALADFEADVMNLFALPGLSFLIARKAHLARKKLVKALQDYCYSERLEQSAGFIKAQFDIASREVADPVAMAAHGGLALAFAAMGPVTTMSFWIISWIFANPELLGKVRAEVDSCLSIQVDEVLDRTRVKIDKEKLYNECPLLFACLAESLRLTSTELTFRMVQEDTQIVDPVTGQPYLLRKGGIVQMVSCGMLDGDDLWGGDSSGFHPERFMPQSNVKPSPDFLLDGKFDITHPPYLSEAQNAAYAPFGSGVHRCPGRLFAQRSVLAFTALFIAGFEVTTPEGGVITPPRLSKKLSISNAKPDGDVQTLIKRRKGFELSEWAFE